MGDGASSSRSGRGGVKERAKERGGIGESVVIDHGRRRNSCGYCRSTSASSVSHGLWANSLTAEDYQELLDHGWRRSGCFLYKPEMDRTCCPSYTIRLKANNFYPSKDQDRVYKRMQRFLDGATSMDKYDNLKQTANSCKGSVKLVCRESIPEITAVSTKGSASSTCEKLSSESVIIHALSDIIDKAVSILCGSISLPVAQFPKVNVKKVTTQAKKKLMNISEDLAYTSNIAFQIAATIRRSQAADAINKSLEPELPDINPRTIAEKLSGLVMQQEVPSELLTKACNGHLNFYSTTKQISSEASNLKQKAQEPRGSQGNAKRIATSENCIIMPPKRRKLEIRLKRSSFDQEEYALYRKYQIEVHDDKPEKVTVSSYKRFLVDTPIIFSPPISGDNSVVPCGFGSFHQQYLIDGKLVAVGVVDILPRCLSSKYLFWDPDFAFLSLGKYSALQEIDWVKETQNCCPSLQYYYLGYYIHSCSKMRYKAAYRPSELLCPLRYQWVPFEIAKPLLERKPYVVLSDYLVEQQSAMLSKHASSVERFDTDTAGCAHIEDSSDEDNDEIDFRYKDTDMDIGDESSFLADGAPVADGSPNCDVGDIVLAVNGLRVKFKDLEKVLGCVDKKVISGLEKQLMSYVRVVGTELAGHMLLKTLNLK
ncbi:arginyl-tRNA--protein transferase 2-like [Zingiber officinale]|uniref:arginyl-tRNA--protein transferase 2-like n=1 Tax=Zingiber officinale TaxID=94328 RepID=UPI001C4D4229|nr:arginyl-tRNA--protein transferase 2-like [Zingiber officinale]